MVSSKTAEEFYQQFVNKEKPYKCIKHHAQQVHIQFSGDFEHQRVIWNAKIKTLKFITKTLSIDKSHYLRQFIYIQASNDKLMPITVGLNVKNISHPTIIKTIIMINNYKSLKIGRHEFGDSSQFD